MSVPHPVPKRGGYLSVSLVEARRAAGLAAGPFALWVGLGLATDVELPRRFVLERAGLSVTADTLKKLPANLRAIEAAGLGRVTVDGDRVRFQRRSAPAKDGRGWVFSRLWRADFDRALAPGDPLTVSLLQAWVCRWLPVLRHDRVQVRQAELAARWGIDRVTVIREVGRLVDAGLLTVQRCGGVSVMADARLELPDTAPIRRLGQSCNVGTGKVASSAPQPAGTPSSARTGGSRHHALDTPATTRQGRYSSTAGAVDSGAGGPGAENKKPLRAPETATGWRLVWQHRWIATAPRRVRCQIAAMLGRLLRLGGPAGLEGLWTLDRLDRMLADADPGGPTTDHARIIRAGLSGLAADAKAARPPTTSGRDSESGVPAGHGPAETGPAEATLAEVQAMAEASLAAAGTTSPVTADRSHTCQGHRLDAAGRMRADFVALAEAGPPTGHGRISDFLTGVLIIRAERTGLPVPTVAARLRIAPEHDDALATAAGTAAMITNQREAVPA